MSTIFDALKKASQESKLHVSKPIAREMEDRLYHKADQARANVSSPLTKSPMLLIGGIVVIVAVVVLVVSLVTPLFQRPEHTRLPAGLQDERLDRAALPPADEPIESPAPSKRTTEDVRSETKKLTVADLTGRPALQAASVPEQNAQPPTIIKINLQPPTPVPATPLPSSAPAVPVASTPSLPTEPASAQQVAQQLPLQADSSSSEEPTTESPAPTEVSAAPVREEGKTFGLALEGIVWDKDTPMAMINGRIVEEGDKIEGVRILKIHKISVEIEKDGKSYSIKY